MVKKPTIQLMFIGAFWAIVVTACASSSGTAVVETNPTTLPSPTPAPVPTQVTEVPTPAIDIQEPPTLTSEPGLSTLGSLEAPPADGCVVYQNGRVADAELPTVHAGPGTQFAIIGQLGRDRWAAGLRVQNGWYEIVVASGVTGWVHESGIGRNGPCDGPGDQEVPVITNRGAPANSRCVAMRPGSSLEEPSIYQAANPESQIVARLGNWADVQQLLPPWYSILLPDGGTGWVEAAKVELSMGCGASGPIRIEFPEGATATTIEGKLPGQFQVAYLFWAAEGQTLDISLTSPENSILFHIEGVGDGQVVKHLLDGESAWQGALPASQDYRLTLDNAGDVAAYTISLSIENP